MPSKEERKRLSREDSKEIVELLERANANYQIVHSKGHIVINAVLGDVACIIATNKSWDRWKPVIERRARGNSA